MIDIIDCMYELLKSIHVLEIHQLCKKTLYTLLVLEFYFKLMSTECAQKDQYHCYDMICCCLSGIILIKLLRMHNISNLIFHTDIKTLEYYEGELNLCTSCH